MISATFPYQKKRQLVLGQEMAYVEVGNGDPIVFLHGNPTSSYLWRNIIPYLEGLGRCIAPDLIGMGDSEKLPDSGPNSYTFVEHRRYLDALLDRLGVKERVTFVVHDWGSALGFDWANRHRDAVKGIVYMEAIINPRTWSDFPVETLLRLVLRGLTAEEMAQYRRPFAEPGEGRRPTLTWPRQIPIDGEPADVTAIVQDYGAWLSGCDIPKLFIHTDPGTTPQTSLDFCRSWPAQAEATVRGLHYPQEDSPDEIGQAVANWLRNLE